MQVYVGEAFHSLALFISFSFFLFLFSGGSINNL